MARRRMGGSASGERRSRSVGCIRDSFRREDKPSLRMGAWSGDHAPALSRPRYGVVGRPRRSAAPPALAAAGERRSKSTIRQTPRFTPVDFRSSDCCACRLARGSGCPASAAASRTEERQRQTDKAVEVIASGKACRFVELGHSNTNRASAARWHSLSDWQRPTPLGERGSCRASQLVGRRDTPVSPAAGQECPAYPAIWMPGRSFAHPTKLEQPAY